MTWLIVFAILVCLGFWWDTSRQNSKIKILLQDYISQYKDVNGNYELKDISREIEKWLDAQ